MSDEVSQFLEQVERLRGQQIEEDEVRARELEEYLAAKRERQARREGKKKDTFYFSLPSLALHYSDIKPFVFLVSSASCMVAEAFWSYYAIL